MSTFHLKHLSCLLGAVALLVGASGRSVQAETAPVPGTVSTSASVLTGSRANQGATKIAQAGGTSPTSPAATPTEQTPSGTPLGTTKPANTTPSTSDTIEPNQAQPGTTTPGTVTPTETTPSTTTPSTPSITPDTTAPSTTSPNTNPDMTISPGRGTRSGSSYVGIGGNIGLGDGDTAIGDGSFAVISKIGLTRSLSVRPSLLIGDTVTILLPVTLDFPIGSGPTNLLGFSAAPYVGLGAAISTGDDSGVDLLLTGGIDVPLSAQFTATAGVNASVTGNPAVGIFVGIGYNFAGF